MDMIQGNYISSIAQEIRSSAEGRTTIPEGEVDDLFAIYAVLALAKGLEVSPEDVHNAWVAWMTPRDPDHESLIPFDQLDKDTARSDEPFVEAILAVARRLGLGGHPRQVLRE